MLPLLPLVALLSASAVISWTKVDHIGRNVLLVLWGVVGAAMPAGVWLIWGNAMLADQFDPFAAGSPLWFCVTLGLSFFLLALAVRFAALEKQRPRCASVHRNGGWDQCRALHPSRCPPTKGCGSPTPLCRRWSHPRGVPLLRRMGPSWGRLVMKSLLWSLPPMAGW